MAIMFSSSSSPILLASARMLRSISNPDMECYAPSISNEEDPSDLSHSARTILESLHNTHDFTQLRRLVSPAVVIQHEDNTPIPGLDAFLSAFQKEQSADATFHMHIKEACVDDIQRKVWVRSYITGFPGGVRKESIDMMTFDADGKMIGLVDSQRVMKRRRSPNCDASALAADSDATTDSEEDEDEDGDENEDTMEQEV